MFTHIPSFYVQKPVQIQAVQFDVIRGYDLANWCRGKFKQNGWEPYIEITTLNGVMRVTPGDWIIKGIDGEFRPCKNDVFEATYNYVGHSPNSTADDLRERDEIRRSNADAEID